MCSIPTEEVYETQLFHDRCVPQEDGCILWTGKLSKGYPSFKGKRIRNYIWNKYHPSDKMVNLKNTCKNNTCINIDHLYHGTTLEEIKKKIDEGSIITESGCHLWQGRVDKKGYGVIFFNKKEMRIHRLTYMIANGINEITEDLVRHKCIKQTNCHNPEHLEGGSFKDNAEDRKRDGTDLSGEKHPNCKITDEIATLIRHSKYPRGHEKYKTMKKRAEEFEVKLSMVIDIDCGRAWSHIPDRQGNINTEASNHRNQQRTKKNRENKENEYTDEMYDTIEKSLKENSIITSENKDGDVPGDCWENTNKPDPDGYTFSVFHGNREGSHTWGAMCRSKRKRHHPNEIVRHLCNNEPCCNPVHVIFGTRSQNAYDYVKKKNGSKAVKLDEHKVREIRKSSKTRKELASEYEVTISTINSIINIWTWKFVE